ncbi:hypothetical protein HYPBUDRAFT_152227 [Hyphopichia burtonii NRRL Y-1933]|uniref:Uncharacterized protein n=1 Tax=Hyphopichia burtonii NRRL Y-1933 TaxID=984485 RepID=A0A1E4RP07_9ASCO|nr:hypothetical protein HYPBUDRAFT_152227 [Hyphopichia burtonii NRRL Y-1933]ODV68997.1 hypothetical protein HYPBUDRAFT_152227 [Hyphopichia burtonii NRRL Y-1933]
MAKSAPTATEDCSSDTRPLFFCWVCNAARGIGCGVWVRTRSRPLPTLHYILYLLSLLTLTTYSHYLLSLLTHYLLSLLTHYLVSLSYCLTT